MRSSAFASVSAIGILSVLAVSSCKSKEAASDAGPAASASAAASVAAAPPPLGEVFVADDVPFGSRPTWAAPGPRADGCPITLRAAKMNEGRLAIWGHGTVAGAKGIYMKVRLVDGDVIVRSTSIGTPFVQQESGWYLVTTGVFDDDKGVKHTGIAAQAYAIQGEGGGKIWESPGAYGTDMDWRYPMPTTPSVQATGAPIGFAPITIERERSKRDETIDVRFVGAIYNGGTTPLERVEFTIAPTDAEGVIAQLRGAWLGMSGGMTAIPPKTWARVDLDVQGDATRLQKATSYGLTVEKTTPSP